MIGRKGVHLYEIVIVVMLLMISVTPSMLGIYDRLVAVMSAQQLYYVLHYSRSLAMSRSSDVELRVTPQELHVYNNEHLMMTLGVPASLTLSYSRLPAFNYTGSSKRAGSIFLTHPLIKKRVTVMVGSGRISLW